MKNDETVTHIEARRIIRELNGLNLAKIHFNDIKEKLNRLLLTEFRGDLIEEKVQFIRANKVEEGRPSNVARLSYPPRGLVTDYQRCNSPKQPVFYCAADPVTACSEVHAQVGDTIYLSKWRVVHPFFSITLNVDGSYGHAPDLVATFVEGKFLQEVHETFSYQYKMTAAISELLFSHTHKLKPMVDELKSKKVPYGLCSISYPSAAHQLHKRCYAIKTIAADNCLQLQSVQEVRLDVIEASNMCITITGKSLRIHEDGNIEWDAEYEKGKVLK